MTLHHSPPCSCSIEQRGENVVFPSPRGRDTHPSTSIRCSEISSSTEGGYSLQSFNIQVISARDITLSLGASCSRKQRRQQLPQQQGLRDIPARTCGLTANRSHSKWQFWDLQYRKFITGLTNCFWASCSSVLLVSGLDHLNLATLPALIRGCPPWEGLSLAERCSKLRRAEKKAFLKATRSIAGNLQSSSPRAQRAFPSLSYTFPEAGGLQNAGLKSRGAAGT